MPIPALGRSLVLFVACAVFFQLILFFKSTLSPSHSPRHRSNYDSESHGSFAPHSGARDPARNRHPTVPLSLKDLHVLDGLADTIAKTESQRVFGDKEIGRIPGTSITKNPTLVKQIRDQIHCWTTHGSWQREEKQFKWMQHRGDARFTKCDKSFVKSLSRVGHGHYLGDYDLSRDQLLVREAVKYRWVPDEKICGPGSGPGHIGLSDARAQYKHQPTKGEFCKAIGQRSMLMVGDLTQYQLHDVILSAFESSLVCYGELGCLHHSAHGLCPGVALKYARNDLLSVPWAVNPEEEEYPSASTVEQTWGTPDMLEKFKVLILNRGLIWRPDEVFLSELVFTMKHLWKYYPDTLVIYRATHPIAPNCTQFKDQGEDGAIADSRLGTQSSVEGTTLRRPLQQPPGRQEFHQDKPEYRPTLADIQRQNRMAKTIVEAAGGIFLDTEAMFAMRPDGRMGDGDCARFCAPGPLDAYGDLLYNTFRILRV
ncbi:hypothetical protein BGX34_010250 [Mortierella sp. NVP85]|nr:hypothetical protein BGX34_010250 [Mortierella sp. NVP85]